MRFGSGIAVVVVKAAPIQPLVWKLPYVAGVVLKRKRNIRPEDTWFLILTSIL